MKVIYDGLRRGEQVSWHARVQQARRPDHDLWFTVPGEFADLVDDSADVAVVGLLVPAMSAGEDLHVTGAVSPDLLFRVNGAVQELLRTADPSLARVNVIAESVRATVDRPQPHGVAAGFSAGVDAYSLVQDYHLAVQVPDSFRLTHLLFNNVGTHLMQDGSDTAFLCRAEMTKAAVKPLGLPLVVVDSNLDDFYGPHLNFERTHMIRNAAVPFLLQGGIGRFIYAAAIEFGDVSARARPRYAPEIEQFGLPILSTGHLILESAGAEYSRSEKVARLKQIPGARSHLNVCTDAEAEGRNCSRCAKCMNTMLALEMAGDLTEFAEVFDLSSYAERRADWIASVATSSSYRATELKRSAARIGFEPLLPSVGALLRSGTRNVRRRGLANLVAAGRDRTTAALYSTYLSLGRPGIATIDDIRRRRGRH